MITIFGGHLGVIMLVNNQEEKNWFYEKITLQELSNFREIDRKKIVKK